MINIPICQDSIYWQKWIQSYLWNIITGKKVMNTNAHSEILDINNNLFVMVNKQGSLVVMYILS